MSRLSALWMVPPVALGIAAAAWFISQAPVPAQVDTAASGLAVRVERLQPQPIRPTARGWGNIRAAEVWTAVAEVKGQVIWRHPDLETGKLIAAGTRVLEIDPGDYRLAIAQAEADLNALRAEATQIGTEAENTGRILVLEESRLALSEADLARASELLAQGVAAQARADEAERATLLARRTVVELRNTLSLVGPRQERIAAQIARTEAALARSRRDLDHTVITAPYDLRVTSVPTERFQYVNIGQVVATGDGVVRAEAVAQLPLGAFQRLLIGTEPVGDVLAAITAGPSARLSAEVRLIADASQVWAAEVARVEGALDARARTIPVVVSIDDPYGGANPPLRPPLLPNMQIEVTLQGAPIEAALALPESALHGNLAYLVDAEGKLELRPVTEAFRQDGIAVIADGLAAGDLVVLDDIVPAIPGMALIAVEPTQ